MARDRDDDRDDRDDEDRPRRRRDRDDRDDEDRPRKVKAGPLDNLFRDTNMVVLILFGVCCNGIALILSLVCVFTATDPTAKSKATTTAIIAGIMAAVGVAANIALTVGGR